MKILFISSRLPYPAVKGDQVILYNRLKHLSRKHEITLLTFYQDDRELKYLEKVKQYCENIETVKMAPFESVINVLLLSAFSKLPLQSIYFKSNKFKQRLNRILDSADFDIVHTYMLRMAEYARHIDKPKVLDLIDSMQLNLEKRLALEKYPKKFLYAEELKRMMLYEKNIVNEYEASIVVSESDRDYIASDKVMAVPLGIDIDKYRRDSPLPDNKTIIFSGNMAYYPNESAIMWFLKKCFESIRKSVPEVRLKIVGINPSNNIKRFHDGKTILVTGFVESIVNEIIASQVAIAPMHSGYGMHIKILEAMSCGLPVVSTSSGVGAIEAISGTDVIVADDPVSFSNHCVGLLQNYEKAQNIGIAARKLIVEKYSWNTHAEKLENIYLTAIRQFRTATQSSYDSGRDKLV